MIGLTLNEAVDKLVDTSKVIQHRMGLKPAEEKRVNDAFRLLAAGSPPADSTGAKQRTIYLDFLRRVQKVTRLSNVALCAAGLGPSAVYAMKDRVRIDLPFQMKQRETEFEYAILEDLTGVYSSSGSSILYSPITHSQLFSLSTHTQFHRDCGTRG